MRTLAAKVFCVVERMLGQPDLATAHFSGFAPFVNGTAMFSLMASRRLARSSAATSQTALTGFRKE